MKRLIARVQLAGRFEAQVIQHADRFWVRLSSIEPPKLLAYWSTKDSTAHPVESVLEGLAARLADFERGTKLYDAIDWWPDGWDYWGGCVPEPIADYAKSDEYADDVASVQRGKLDGR